jgi:hypothetical protein
MSLQIQQCANYFQKILESVPSGLTYWQRRVCF